MSGTTTAWVVGATSLLGWSIVRLRRPGWRAVPCCSPHSRSPRTQGWRRFNVEDPAAWRAVAEARPDVVVHCAAVCHVQRCEADPPFATRINVGGVRAMLEALDADTRIVYCSSDHVFGCGGPDPITETSRRAPISVYGKTRAQAEDLVLRDRPDALVVRVGLPIGPSLDGRTGHLDWLRYRHAAGLSMTVVAGEHRAAFDAEAGAARIADLAMSQIAGIRHLAATHVVERPMLAAHLCRRLGIETPRYEVVDRTSLPRPHLGRVELSTRFAGDLAHPLACEPGR
jgi:dTDP-4-dehydrorhamnose reductase